LVILTHAYEKMENAIFEFLENSQVVVELSGVKKMKRYVLLIRARPENYRYPFDYMNFVLHFLSRSAGYSFLKKTLVKKKPI
jgi:hypothetical protein